MDNTDEPETDATDEELSQVQSAVDKPLEPRQKAFVEQYCIDRNGMQAAIRAGYASKHASSWAAQLMGRPHIAAAIERALADRTTRINVSQESVLQEMSLLSNSCVEHFNIDDEGQVVPAEGSPPGCMRAIQSIKRKVEVHPQRGSIPGYKVYHVEVRLWDKPGPLKLMGRHVGLFPDKVEVTGKNGGPIETVTKIERVIVDPAGNKE